MIGVILALPREAKALLGRQYWKQSQGYAVCDLSTNDKRLLRIVCAGVGPRRAASAAQWLSQKASILMSVGVSGGLDPGLKPGDLIAASSVLEAGARPFEYTSERQRHWANRMVGSFANMGLTARSGKLLSAARPVLSVAAKRDLFRRTGALAVDMETAAAAEVAEKTNLPFMALRSVCDPAHRPVPHQLFDCLDSDGRVRLPVLILTLLKEPSLLPRLLQAQQDFSRAARALRRGWPACVRILSAGNSGAAG